MKNIFDKELLDEHGFEEMSEEEMDRLFEQSVESICDQSECL